MSPTPPSKTDRPKRKPEPIGLRVSRRDGGVSFHPASPSDEQRLKTARMADGDLLFVQLKKPRNPGFHRLAHAIGVLAVENIEDFDHYDAHDALKRLQLESGAACEEMQGGHGIALAEGVGLDHGESWESVLRRADDRP